MIFLITSVVSSVNKTFTLILQIHEMQRLSNEGLVWSMLRRCQKILNEQSA